MEERGEGCWIVLFSEATTSEDKQFSRQWLIRCRPNENPCFAFYFTNLSNFKRTLGQRLNWFRRIYPKGSK